MEPPPYMHSPLALALPLLPPLQLVRHVEFEDGFAGVVIDRSDWQASILGVPMGIPAVASPPTPPLRLPRTSTTSPATTARASSRRCSRRA